jgi:hypothetical protein
MARLIRYRNEGKIADGDYKTLVWGLAQLLGYWKHEADLRIEDRLQAIEDEMARARQ